MGHLVSFVFYRVWAPDLVVCLASVVLISDCASQPERSTVSGYFRQGAKTQRQSEFFHDLKIGDGGI